jgi:hypothetical protein
MFTAPQPSILFDLAIEHQHELQRQAEQARLCSEMTPAKPSLTFFNALLHPLRRSQNQPKSAVFAPISAG